MNEHIWQIVIYALRVADAVLRLVETVLKRAENKNRKSRHDKTQK